MSGGCQFPNHAGTTGYKRGCRCERCVIENRAYVLRAKSKRMSAGDIAHGTLTGYGDGCRCADCKRASSECHLRYREEDPERYRSSRRRASKRYSDSHDAKRIQREQQRHTQELAWRNRYQWTGPELEVALRRDLTAYQAALMLGRTQAAVQMQRDLHEVDVRKQNLAGLPRRKREQA